jgi:short-subunit dehydrogenase
MTMPGRHIAITGASSGIGAALALVYARQGCRLALAGRNAERLQAIADLCTAAGARVDTAIVDVRDAQNVRDWIDAADDIAPLDIVVACAGVGGAVATAGTAGEEFQAAEEIIGTNLLGAINTALAALKRFVDRRGGQIVLVGSLMGRLGFPHAPVYSASKAGLAIYADALRRLARQSGVDVTLVEPGFVDTPMSAGLDDRMMLWSAERAAAAIASAIDKRKPKLAFPRTLALLARLGAALPRPVADRILIASYRRSMKS